MYRERNILRKQEPFGGLRNWVDSWLVSIGVFGMGIASDDRVILLVFALSFLLQQGVVHSRCPPVFTCPNLPAQLLFPLTDSRRPDCGLLMINCTVPTSMIRFVEHGPWYNVLSINQFPYQSITFTDQKLEYNLQNNRCEAFNNFSVPSSPLVLFTLNKLTMFKCENPVSLATREYFQGYKSYTKCGGFVIYYNLSNFDGLVGGIPPTQCSVIQMPRTWEAGKLESNELFDIVTANATYGYNVSSDCLKCHSKGGQCDTNPHSGQFHCVNGTRRKVVILATVIPGTVLLLVALLIYWHRHHKQKEGSSNLLVRGIFSNRSKSDLEKSAISYGVPVFSYNELEEATNNFDSSKELGDGGFGTVYYGKLRDGREVAVKRLYENNYKRVEQFLNEVEILTRLRHPNLVTLYGCTSRHSRELLLVYEFIPNGTVADHLHGNRANGSLTWPIRMSIAIETACALAYLHASDIIHRDVKTTNILLDSNFSVKVADFGLSRLFPTDVTHISTAPQGTPGYVDPEYYQCYQLTTKSDVYSFGVVLIELISSMPAVDISRHRHEINLANLAINRIRNSAVDELIDPLLGFESDSKVRRMTTSVAELAFQCLQHETDMRPTMDEVLNTLERISSDECAEEESVASGALKDVQPLASPDCDEVVLLKDRRPPLSPSSVTDKWVSSASSMNNFSS